VFISFRHKSLPCREKNNSSSPLSKQYGHWLRYSSVDKYANNQLSQSYGAAVRSFWNCGTSHSRLSSTEAVVLIFLSLEVAFCGSLQCPLSASRFLWQLAMSCWLTHCTLVTDSNLVFLLDQLPWIAAKQKSRQYSIYSNKQADVMQSSDSYVTAPSTRFLKQW